MEAAQPDEKAVREKMNELLFSVILPVYNVAPYLPECLDTLLPQTDDSTEVILVDDGATDGSGAICDTYAARFAQNVRVIHQPNRGVAAARNTGLKAASGAYIVWVDPDDLPAADLLTSIK